MTVMRDLIAWKIWGCFEVRVKAEHSDDRLYSDTEKSEQIKGDGIEIR
jgi:hypothetical protein